MSVVLFKVKLLFKGTLNFYEEMKFKFRSLDLKSGALEFLDVKGYCILLLLLSLLTD